MSDLVKVLAGLLVLGGSALTATAAIGLLRLPDLYTRMHAASKAGTVGTGLSLLALALTAAETGETLRALAAILFFVLTTPLSAHLLAKAAHSVGYPAWEGTVLDEMPAEETGSPAPAGDAARPLATK